MTQTEALRLALKALETLHDENMDYLTRNKLGGENNQCMVFARDAITAIKAALEAKDELWESEMRNELVALGFDGQCPESIGITLKRWRDGYAAPQRTWVGLTAEEREQVQAESYGKVPHHVALISAVEAKLKEKNT